MELIYPSAGACVGVEIRRGCGHNYDGQSEAARLRNATGERGGSGYRASRSSSGHDGCSYVACCRSTYEWVAGDVGPLVMKRGGRGRVSSIHDAGLFEMD